MQRNGVEMSDTAIVVISPPTMPQLSSNIIPPHTADSKSSRSASSPTGFEVVELNELPRPSEQTRLQARQADSGSSWENVRRMDQRDCLASCSPSCSECLSSTQQALRTQRDNCIHCCTACPSKIVELFAKCFLRCADFCLGN